MASSTQKPLVEHCDVHLLGKEGGVKEKQGPMSTPAPNNGAGAGVGTGVERRGPQKIGVEHSLAATPSRSV
jgi:hypothetical protein